MTVIGPDRPGLVEELSKTIASHEGSWLESRMAHLAGHFAGLLRVECPDEKCAELVSALQNLEGLSVQVAEELASQFPDLVKVVALDENGGPTKARNAGAKIAAGYYYFFLDSDTRMFPDTLERFSHRIPDADAVSGIYHFEPLNDEACARYKAILTYYMFAREGVIDLGQLG